MASNDTPISSSNQHSLQPQPQPLHQQQHQQQQQQQSPLPNTQLYRAISRNNSNASTSSSNKGEFSSTLSTTNSVTSSRSQLASRAHQLIATCGAAGSSSTPIRSFQRATISSVVKTRAFDNNPVLKGLLSSASPSGQNSSSNSQTPSPLSTPVFSRSRSLRMSGGPRRYQQSPNSFRNSSRTPEIYSFNPGDTSMTLGSYPNETQARLLELSSERSELKESLEFLECERQVLIDSTKELKDILQRERAQWKKEQDDLKKQLTDCIAARVRAESQLTRLDVDTNDIRSQSRKINEELMTKIKQIDSLKENLVTLSGQLAEQKAINEQFQMMLNEKLRFNGQVTSGDSPSEYVSVVTEMARLRLELNEKDKILAELGQQTPTNHSSVKMNHITNDVDHRAKSYEYETLNKFLDQTVECIKRWPDDLANSDHVRDLMKTLLSAYKPGQGDDLSSKFENIHL